MGARGAALLAVASLTFAHAQQQASDQTAPTFRSEINYVQLPVRVLDGRGQFVGGLTQADFQVFEDGNPQTITAFSAVDIPFIQPDATVADVPLAAVVMIGVGRGQNFTRNGRLLYEAIDRFIADPDSAGDVHRVLNRIADTVEWMGSIKGRRKALVLVTASPICVLNDRIEQTAGSTDSGCQRRSQPRAANSCAVRRQHLPGGSQRSRRLRAIEGRERESEQLSLARGCVG